MTDKIAFAPGRLVTAKRKLREQFPNSEVETIIAAVTSSDPNLMKLRDALFELVDVARLNLGSPMDKPMKWKSMPDDATFGMAMHVNDVFLIDMQFAAEVWRIMAEDAPSSLREMGHALTK